MDQLFWKSDWHESSDNELFRKVHEVTSRSRWVLDGNYTRTIPVKWKQVQLVIWLDPSFLRTILRVTKRTIYRSFTQEEIWPGTGNRESLRKAFLSRDSIIWWAITTYRQKEVQFHHLLASVLTHLLHSVEFANGRRVLSQGLAGSCRTITCAGAGGTVFNWRLATVGPLMLSLALRLN